MKLTRWELEKGDHDRFNGFDVLAAMFVSHSGT